MINEIKSRPVISLLSRLIRNEEGSTLPFIALTLPVVLGMVGLGTDASLWMAEKRSLQTAADAAVLAAGWEAAMESHSYMETAAAKEAHNNGYDANGANSAMDLQVLQESADGMTVSIVLTQEAETFFSKIISSNPIMISARAEAMVTSTDGQFCILSLAETGGGTFTTNGTVDVNAPDCGVAVNSTDASAITMRGNVDVTVGAVRVSGDVDIAGSVNFAYSSLATNASATSDPYADLVISSENGCAPSGSPTRVNSSTTLTPGVYCGGISISGNNNIIFEPGVYIIDGGDFNVSGQGSLYGDGVTFILTGGESSYAGLNIAGGREIEFNAPVGSGSGFDGLVFAQNRNAPTGTREQNKIVGTNDITINGVMYFPSQGLWFGGDATLAGVNTPCTKLIADTITLAGNPMLGNSCEDTDVVDLGLPIVKLLR